jgi:hypothetical protein
MYLFLFLEYHVIYSVRYYPRFHVTMVGLSSGVPRNFFRELGFQQIQLRTEGRENVDLGALTPWSGVLLNLQMSEPRILIRLLRMYFPWNWEFCSPL